MLKKRYAFGALALAGVAFGSWYILTQCRKAIDLDFSDDLLKQIWG